MLRPTITALPALPSLPEPLKIRKAAIEDAEELSKLCGRAFFDEVWNTKSINCLML